MFKEKVKNLFLSRKFWAMLCGIAIPIINTKMKLELSTTEVAGMLALVSAYVVGTGIEDKLKGSK